MLEFSLHVIDFLHSLTGQLTYRYLTSFEHRMSTPSAQLDEYLAFAIDLGKKAGELIKEGQAKRFANKATLDTKQNSIDVSRKWLVDAPTLS